MLNTLIFNAAHAGRWDSVNGFLAINFNSSEVLIDLTEFALEAASQNNWFAVLICLEINKRSCKQVVNFKVRHQAHPEGWRLFDYAKATHPDLKITMWDYGARPSYDIELFAAARKGDWNSVFKLIDDNLIDVNITDAWDPFKRTVLNHAVEQDNFIAINGLLICRGAKETILVDNVLQLPTGQESALSYARYYLNSIINFFGAYSIIPPAQNLPTELPSAQDNKRLLPAPRATYSPNYRLNATGSASIADYLEQTLENQKFEKENTQKPSVLKKI